MKTTEEAREDARRKARIMLAWADGAKIEGCWSNSSAWNPIPIPAWNWQVCQYRIAPEQRPAAEEKTP